MAGSLIRSERIRLLIDVDNWSATLQNLVVPASPSAVIIPNGSTLQFELFAFDSSVGALGVSNSQIDYTNIVSFVIAMQDQGDPHNAVTYWSITIANALINNAATTANWTNGSDQQIKQVVSSALNSFPTPTSSQNFWLCLYAITDGSNRLYATGTAVNKGDIIIDTNGNAQIVTTVGTTGGSAPSWATALAATTTDNTVTWTRVNVNNETMPFSTFQVALKDTGMPIIILSGWPLAAPDGTLHLVSLIRDSTGAYDLFVDQTPYTGKSFAAPFVSSQDGVATRLPTLVLSGNQLLLTAK